ncbi:helix-turn-helix transcriptional regulator [Jannaschia pohangensis]|uniref:Autoinducer binding domain-containing protein n=1 Tax=Jannaschia pohangensis TaxID=390807 RepID=A0A1I3I2I9_9RHOB|nr:LuxR family transcriptional regulator [Jannaschia pohangensis]SFI42053.1 Autoinducer binding domain-containing protein [Jannaschia pohangensis]
MLYDRCAEIEALSDADAVWRRAIDILADEGIPVVMHLASAPDRSDVRVMTTTPEIHAAVPPADDPFLEHCCSSYRITHTGAAFLDDYPYLPDIARDFIKAAVSHGFRSGLGIPMRLEGSPRFGGFNLGSPLDRVAFEAQIIPREEEFRLFCLVVHRRLEELSTPPPVEGEDLFRHLLLSPPASRLDALSPREREVLYLQARGLSRKEVARMCGISPHTVAEYTANAYRKTGIRNRAEAARVVFGA